MLICLGNPEAREWIQRQISYVIETYNIDWLKWDNNLWGICNRPDHGHQAGDGNYAQIQGLYEVLDYLHRKYPELIIENCASGGNRMDFGIMKRTHIFWVHDDSFTSYVCRYHHYGSTFAFLPEYLNSWVIQDGDFTRALGQSRPQSIEQQNGLINQDKIITTERLRAGPKPTLDYIFRSRMLGTFGISLRTLDWSPELKQLVKDEIETYKQLRKYLKGEFYHLTPQTVIYNKTWEPPKSWEVFQYRLKDESVIFYFRDDDNNDTFLIHPQGINSNKKYQIIFLDSKEKRIVTGAQLLKQGLELKLVDRLSSGIVLIQIRNSNIEYRSKFKFPKS
jgi:alpha-galactosidase